MSLTTSEHHSLLKIRRAVAVSIIPYGLIWGTQWSLNAILQYIWMWPYQAWLTPATLIPALLLTLIVWLRQPQTEYVPSTYSTVALFLLFGIILGGIIILQWIQAIDPFFPSILHAFVLSAAFVAFGGWIGRQPGTSFLLLGGWLFSLTCIVSLFYPGFSSAVLGFFGGLGLLAASWILRRWKPA